jgi:hypothetical protein
VEENPHQLIDGKHPIILCFQPSFWWCISHPPYFWPLAMNDMNKYVLTSFRVFVR